MKNAATGLCFSLLLIAAGCATRPVAEWDAATVAANTSVVRDKVKEITTVSSQVVRFDRDEGAVTHSAFRLRAEREDGEAVIYSVVVGTHKRAYEDWAYWREARDNHGGIFPLYCRDQHEVGPGIKREISWALVPRQYLDGIKQTGAVWQIKGDGMNARDEFTIEPNLVQGFLAKCDKEFGQSPLHNHGNPTK